MTKAERSRNLRYKKPMLADLGYQSMLETLLEIQENCLDIKWATEEDNGTLLNALDDNEDDEFEFRMSFAMLEAECENLYYLLTDHCISEYFDTCTVALIGNRFNTVGFDDYEEDYYSLTYYERGLAYTEAGKRIMRMTKSEMLSTIGQCLGIILSFQNVLVKYDYLKATMDILKDENHCVLKIIKEIESAYEDANKDEFCWREKSTKRFDRLVESLPEKFWIE